MDELKQLADELARAQEAAKELDTLDDQLSDLIPEYEEALKKLRLGVSLSVTIDGGEGWSRQLSFDKYSGAWRLVLEEGPDAGDPEQWTTTPLASASRDERATVFAWYMPKLLSSAARQINDKIQARKDTLKLAQERLAAIKNLSVKP